MQRRRNLNAVPAGSTVPPRRRRGKHDGRGDERQLCNGRSRVAAIPDGAEFLALSAGRHSAVALD